MALDISKASPIALFFVRLTNRTSSNELDMQRKAIAEPTLPLPIIEISKISSLLFNNQNRTTRFLNNSICNTSKNQFINSSSTM